MALLGLIGNPENRRVHECLRVASDSGWTTRCWSYLDLIDSEDLADLEDCSLLRIDSPGENDEVARQLIALGGGPQQAHVRHGEIGYQKEYHRGYCRFLDRLTQLSAPFMNPPEHIQTMFDKWACHLRFADAGLPRPKSFLAPTELSEFLAAAKERPTGRLFLKPLHGSSASGVCAYRWAGDLEQLIAPLEIEYGPDGARFFNSLRIRSYTDTFDIRGILRHLLSSGMIAEHWLPKAQLDGKRFDLRIVVIDGEAQHVVIRTSRHPMTNLHLGNARGDVEELAETLGREALSDCRRLAEQALACFPGQLYAGVDIMLTPRLQPVVLEINAFGDLLPGVDFEGRSTYASILKAARELPTPTP